MKLMSKIAGAGAATGLTLFAALPAWAQEAAEAAADAAPAAAEVAEAVAVANPGNNAWMMTSTILVLLMILPGLALFYGGLARTKNMLSVMTQVGAAACLAMLLWVIYGYGLAFGPEGNAYIAWGKWFLAGVNADSTAATFTDEVISEYVFIAFQMTFSAITLALVLGAVVERMKFSAVMVFGIIWLTIVYYPIAHMVWAGGGLFFEMGALDFAGGTVVHINAGVSALVACIVLGKRIGYQKDVMAPHSLTMTMVGTGLLWVGWFGFNAGSALEANGSAGLAMINTFVATASAAMFWMLAERISGHKASALGFCSGVIAGLVAVTPAAGNSGPFGAILLGAVASLVCFFAVTKIKTKLGYDDSLDAFGIHGVGGIVGAIGTAVTMLPAIGGPGADDYALGGQLVTQLSATAATVAWAAVGTAIAISVAKAMTGLRVTEEAEREGLDLAEHGERAYNY
ncbi:MAG: ammonium transporter [Sphingopyxis sp.]|nr:ammonium transporter [Sphingopyxis sp.]